MSRYSNIETSLAMSTLATWFHVVQSRDVRSRVFSRPLKFISQLLVHCDRACGSTVVEVACDGLCVQREASDDDDDDDDQCALSDRWTYQRHSRQWSRFDSDDLLLNQSPSHPAAMNDRHAGGAVGALVVPAADDWTLEGSLRSTASCDSAIDASLIGSNSFTLTGGTCTDVVVVHRRPDVAPFPQLLTADVPPPSSAPVVSPSSRCTDSDRSSVGSSSALRRSAATDRLRGACRSVLRKVENRMKRRAGSASPTSPAAVFTAVTSSSPMEISSPTVVDEVAMRARMDALRCVDLTSSSQLPASIARGLLQHSAPATPTDDRYLPGLVDSASMQRRGRQRSLDSARVSVYDNVIVTSPNDVIPASPPDDDPQRQLDAILSALYRDIGVLSTSLAVVDEERSYGSI